MVGLAFELSRWHSTIGMYMCQVPIGYTYHMCDVDHPRGLTFEIFFILYKNPVKLQWKIQLSSDVMPFHINHLTTLVSLVYGWMHVERFTGWSFDYTHGAHPFYWCKPFKSNGHLTCVHSRTPHHSCKTIKSPTTCLSLDWDEVHLSIGKLWSTKMVSHFQL